AAGGAGPAPVRHRAVGRRAQRRRGRAARRPGLAGQPRADRPGRGAARPARGPQLHRHGEQLGRPALHRAGERWLLRRARRHPHGLLPRPADPAGRLPRARHPGRRRRGGPVARLLRPRGRGPAPPRGTLGGRRVAVRTTRRLHHRPVHRVAVLRRRVLGLGTRPRRPLGWRRRARGRRLHRPGVRAVPARRARRDDPDLPRSRPARPAPSAGLAAAARRRHRRLRHLPARSDGQLDRLVHRAVDGLGPRADHPVAVLPQHDPGDRPRRVRRPPVVGCGVPRRGGLDGGRDRRHRLVPASPVVGRGQLGRGPGARLLVVLLVLLRQPRHAALVPALGHARPLGHLGAGSADRRPPPPGARAGGVGARRRAPAVVELAVLHRSLGQL
ncbi:MAG: Putative membrane-spanning protein, partial [uncultured Friedmanniella sp.]